MKESLFKSYKRGDLIIAFAVMIQPLLVVLQFLMISIFYIPEEQTTFYRVILTAIPMIIAIIVAAKHKFGVFLCSYILLFIFLGVELLLFPQNASYILSDSFRFLIPVIVPSIICLSCLKDISLIERVLYLYSWVIVIMTLIFVVRFVQGKAEFQSYNMGLSYALLLPMMTLYKKGTLFSYFGAVFCFLTILVFGSRGGLVAGVIYIVYDLYKKKRRYLLYIIISSFFIVNVAMLFGDYLNSLGISSRTLSFIIGGGMSSAEGRDVIYDKAIALISNNFLFGLGIYGDRVNMDGEYCHNIILEICLDYGVVVGMILLIGVVLFFVRLYLKLNSDQKNVFIKYSIVLLVPLFASSSYLIDCNFGVYWGIVAILCNEVKQQKRELRLSRVRLLNDNTKLSQVNDYSSRCV